jgi:transposase-like protein
MPGRTFSREFKLELVRQIEAGDLGPAQACREHQLARSLLDRWRQQYQQQGEFAFSPAPASEQEALERRVAELERFCGQLALENSILKKALQTARSRSDTR